MTLDYTFHGTLTGYTSGCRCDICREGWRDYARGQRELKRAQGLPEDDDRHGTVNGYNYWGCRCEACKSAVREAAEKRRLRAYLSS